MTETTIRDYNIDKKTQATPHIKPYLGWTQTIHCMNCCEALDALSFKLSSWDQVTGPRQQSETIILIKRITQPPII